MRTTLVGVVKKKLSKNYCDYLDAERSYVMFIIEVKTRLVSGTETFWVRREIVLCYKSYCKVFPVETVHTSAPFESSRSRVILWLGLLNRGEYPSSFHFVYFKNTETPCVEYCKMLLRKVKSALKVKYSMFLI